ncbi:hypothetical protein ACIP98_38280 [Streptomyces sp. NPDC088354]|uniref:hypothetical protein n=1 Tax=Streptomyces sp. NPDC088354 TaxID=3365856 RepID=UPI00380E6AEA
MTREYQSLLSDQIAGTLYKEHDSCDAWAEGLKLVFRLVRKAMEPLSQEESEGLVACLRDAARDEGPKSPWSFLNSFGVRLKRHTLERFGPEPSQALSLACGTWVMGWDYLSDEEGDLLIAVFHAAVPRAQAVRERLSQAV